MNMPSSRSQGPRSWRRLVAGALAWPALRLRRLGRLAAQSGLAARLPALILLFALGIGGGYLARRLGAAGPARFGLPASLKEAGGMEPDARAGLPKTTATAATGTLSTAVTPEQRQQASAEVLAGALPGSLVWPADGLVVATAGWRRHPERGDWRYLPGVELAVPSRAPVRAAAAGTVRSVDVQSDGFTVVIDHGQGWSTIYGNLSSVRVQRGQALEAGMVIGYGPRLPEVVPTLAGVYGVGGATEAAGEPGASVRAVISFAVYHGTESVDPLAVMPAASYRVAGPDNSEGQEAAGGDQPAPAGP